MIYLLDTNACIHHLKFADSPITRKLSIHLYETAVSSVTKAELFYGAMRSNNPTQSIRRQQDFLKLFPSLPFDDDAARICGRIRAQLSNQGKPIGAYDLQIAAISLVHDLTLVTHNVREFSRVQDLKIEDWQSE
ncbi:MAG: type II toxin-antitoxin system VapC family toxin [Hormoscilla sp.]